MRRTVSIVSASTLLLLAACGPAAAPPPAATTAPAAPAATTAPAAPAATTAARRTGSHRCRTRRGRADHRRQASRWRSRTGRPAEDHLLAGADHPEQPPRPGHQGLRRLASGARAARGDGTGRQTSRLAGCRGPDRRQRWRVARPQDRHLEAEARASNGPTAPTSPPPTWSSPTSTSPTRPLPPRTARSPKASRRSKLPTRRPS